jgi:hypothetical protein
MQSFSSHQVRSFAYLFVVNNLQIHANFMSLLLHLNEDDEDVCVACKVALKQIGPLLESTKTNEYEYKWALIRKHVLIRMVFPLATLYRMFQKHLKDDGKLQYGDFMNDLSKIMVC